MRDLKYLYPMICFFMGRCLRNVNLPFFPWKFWVLILIGLSAVYVQSTLFGTRMITVTRYLSFSKEEQEEKKKHEEEVNA